ncbi:fidgetin-like protein 1 [Drosophila mojavensis]|uniref:AAA+ ATPase domain-containing protein n=1 Tax=Drosophila mojavensis TaxID=7230 RepID=B4KG74_DROMO|nr:fidgetin-like protein 1 [Drosophila mojavensis]EDW11061.2 uncharacterized protein Dmoj_GI15929 [Drosophila mojavensis]
MTDELWSSEYAANETIRLNKNVSAGDYQNAWRKQKLILAHATSNLSETIRYEVLKEHQQLFSNASSTEVFMNDCLSGCRSLLTASRRRRAAAELQVEWRQPPDHLFEPVCRGKYESCKHDENIELKRSPKGTPPEKAAVPVSSTASLVPAPGAAGNVGFRTAREQLLLHEMQKTKKYETVASILMDYRKKSLGGRACSLNANFVQPVGRSDSNVLAVPKKKSEPAAPAADVLPVPAALADLDSHMVQQIMRESMHKYKPVTWDDIAGLDYAKSTFMETIIHPLQRPDLFKGIRRPPRGVLLFGPPGTGKTLIAKCIASQSKATFFSINPSTLTSKWVGEGEKMVKTLFAVAAAHQPAIIFMDEVDSLLSQRSDSEHESSRRIKNEFFIQLDGAVTNEDDHVVVIGATNRPQELDEAVRRRFVRRIYVSLPVAKARQLIIQKLIQQIHHNLSDAQIEELAKLTEGYSGADMDSLCRYAAMQPLRALTTAQIDVIDAQQLPAVTMADFTNALQHISKSVSADDVKRYVSWNLTYGIER